MTARDDGGPAFPTAAMQTTPGGPVFGAAPGMTLRDWFAGMALQGICHGNGDVPFDGLAMAAYLVADAMLAERAK